MADDFKPPDRHPVGWLMAGVVTLFAAVAFVAILVAEPVAGGWLFSLAVVGWVCWWVPNRGLRAELEAVATRKDTAVEAAFDTAFELQRVSGEHDEIEVEPFMADSQRPPAPCPENGHHVTVGRRALHDWLTWCSCGWEAESTKQSEANEQALVHRQQIAFAEPAEPLSDEEWRGFADFLGIDRSDHLGQPCGWSEDGTTTCGEPAEGWARWPDGEPTWFCAAHMAWMRSEAEDDPGDTLPRSIPGRID